ncbi:MAG: metallophosphoesterase [Clostridiales bacterium]|nr:metallophosphoesterase [Clostridiales bacterium]
MESTPFMRTVFTYLTVVILFVQSLFGVVSKEDFEFYRDALKDTDAVINERHAGTPSEYRWSADSEFDISECFTVKKEKGKDFTVLNIADIHFSDLDYRAYYAFHSMRIVKRLVTEYKPDLITLTGDNVCADSTYWSISRLTKFMDSFGIPWAPVYGNHDDEGNCDLNYLSDVMTSSRYCLFKKGDPSMGNGNYIINVEEGDGDDAKVVETVFMMDSHHSTVNDAQQAWFTWAADGIEASLGYRPEISVFFHIPIAEYQYGYDLNRDEADKKWIADGAMGVRHEEICCERNGDGPVQRGVFDTLKAGGTKYIFCGHDHINNFTFDYEGVRLTYCTKVGRGSGYQPGIDVGTVIRVSSDGIKSITARTYVAGIGADLWKFER